MTRSSVAGSGAINVGPYTFTATDSVRTLASLGRLWEFMLDRRHSKAADALGDGLADRLRAATGAPLSADLGALGVAAAAKLRDAGPILAGVVADVWRTLRAASDVLRADGQMPPTAIGIVTQLSASAGGVPKLALEAVDVDFGGLVGDGHAHRVHHGRPWQALCIWADEVIDAFRSSGHPLHRGAAGENITITGLPWADVRPGVRMQIGGVTALVQAYAEPCNANARWFLEGDFTLMDRSRGPVSRVYATVLEPGRIATGDAAILEP